MTAPPRPAAQPVGRSRTITLITPIRPLRTWVNRLLFAVADRFPETMGIRALGSVYFTRWTVLTAIPYNGPPQVAERPAHPCLIWESDFTGLTDPYIEEFVHMIGRQIGLTWRTSFGFPGTGSVTQLTSYIQDVELPRAHYFAAYPEASVRMVLSALAVAREHRFLLEAARTTTPEEFEVVYRGFLQRRQGDL